MTLPNVQMLSGGRRSWPDAPLITVDLDGVLCEPPFGWNVTAHGSSPAPTLERPSGRLQRWLWPAESMRYLGRRCMPGAESFLNRLAPHYRLIVVTARGRPSAGRTRGWLRRNRLWQHLDGLVFRARPDERSYAFKAAAIAELRPSYHVDDDGRTAITIVERTGRPVVLVAWQSNAGTYPKGIIRLPDLAAAATFLLKEAGLFPSASPRTGSASTMTNDT